MTVPTPPAAPVSRMSLALLAFAILAWAVAAFHLAWLGLHFVPKQAAILRGLGVPMPFLVRMLHVVPNQTMRGTPIVVLAAPFVVLVCAAAARRVAGRPAWPLAKLVRALTALALATATLAVLASFATVWSIQSVYQRQASEMASPR